MTQEPGEQVTEERLEVGRDGSSGLYEEPNASRLKGWKAFVQHIWIGRDRRGRFRSLRRKQ